MKFGAKSPKVATENAGKLLRRGLLDAISPKLAAVKAAGKLASMLAWAKLRANMRKWNRGKTGARDDAKTNAD